MLTWFITFTDILGKMGKILFLSVLFLTRLSLISPYQVQVQVSQEKPVSRIVEDGGTGPFSAIMLTESTLQTHINHVPVFAANMDVGHGGTYSKPHGGEFAKVATSWLLWQLKGDKKAGKLFRGKTCGLSLDPDWKVEKKNMK